MKTPSLQFYMFECCAERKRVGWGWGGNEESGMGLGREGREWDGVGKGMKRVGWGWE